MIGMIGLVAAAGLWAVEVGEVVYIGSTATDPALLNMEVGTEPLARIIVEGTPNFVERWLPLTAPVVAVDGSTPISVPLEALRSEGFFRIVVQPPRVSVVLEQSLLKVEVTEDGVTPEEILIGLHRLLGELPSLTLPYDPADEETSPKGIPTPVGKGIYRGIDLAHLGKQLGWHLGDMAPEKDDPADASAYVPLNTDRGRPHQLPGDGGTGVIDDGWQGDAIKLIPDRIVDLPTPGSFDMKFTPDKPFEDINPKTEVEPPTGKHVRLRLKFDGKTFKFERALAQDTGDGMRSIPFPLPVYDSFIIAVRNAAGGIYHLLPFEDPRIVRSYDPPQGGSHGHQMAGDGSVRLTLPILGDDVIKGLEGIQVSILQFIGPYKGDATLLTPDLVNRNPNLFTEVAKATGSEIVALLRDPGPRRGLRAATKAATVTTLHRSGTNGSKFNVAVMGDGFRDTTGNQDTYNNYVENTVMDTLRNRDVHQAVLNGMNVFRINTFSEESGITTVNAMGNVTNAVSTALEYRYSGNWNRCWMEPGPNSQTLIDDVLDDICPQADFVVLVLNTGGQGGCANGERFNVTLGASWAVVAHEFGHRPGTSGDEYQCNPACGCYGGAEPSAPNLTANTTRATLKWNTWVPAYRPLPTTQANIANTDQDVGLFAGATIGQNQWTTCIFRPSWRGRMNNNTPIHNPVGYTTVREAFRPFQTADFRKNVVGDFNGDGRLDAVLQDERQHALYVSADRNVGADDPVSGSPPRGVTGVLVPTWFRTDFMPNAAGTALWRGRAPDILLPADFNNDGMDDLYIVNHSSWDMPYVAFMRSYGDRFEPVGGYCGDLPGWERRAGDEFYVADFDNDGREDLIVFNGTNWSIPYLGMLRSTGAGLQMVRRYDKFLPGWEMGKHEKIHVGDFNGDGRDDLISFNRHTWAQVHLLVYTSTGTGLTLEDRHYGTIPGSWQMRRQDVLHVLDFTGDGKSDIALFNGLDWTPTYLCYLASDDGELTVVRRYDNDKSQLPGWELERRDRFHVANVDGDADDDLVVYNKDNWVTQYLGILRSNGGRTFSVAGSWQDDWINGWNLGPSDQFKVGDFRGTGNWDDLFVFNESWFGLLRGKNTYFRLETIYRKWIYNHRFHSSGWW